ncbi:MAG: ribosome recycling factor [Parcubacteria group bacterium Athens1014_10]|nr:MAG: ribosome recycling factor [Parcubacteria group bacterium Athens1014_10]TSD04716.1 MAG: ribosome recycling factor [Parcubacteria group bacterium Athens0714_12]
MLSLIENHKPNFQKIIEHLKKELLTLRTSRATPALVENILVEAYGSKTPLKQLAGITIPETRTIMIQLWDKNIIKEVEKSISQSNLNLSPNTEGNIIRINLPSLTEENRKNLIKILHQKLEQNRIEIRNLRDKIKEEIVNKFKEKEVSEDDKFKLIEELDKITHKYNEEIKGIGEKKEKEIMTI